MVGGAEPVQHRGEHGRHLLLGGVVGVSQRG